MSRVFIIGNKGNMGRRYTAILNHYKIDCDGCDVGDKILPESLKFHDSFIIATPTISHIEIIKSLLIFDKPILCEKPLTTDIIQLRKFSKEVKGQEYLITMVNQYAGMIIGDMFGCSKPKTDYDYWNTGKDGLHWDCINIVGLADQKPTLGNKSPVWKCRINDEWLNIKDMDHAYMNMIYDWNNEHESNFEYALDAHEKVARWFE